ncbi:MAG: hypothetical protein WC718_18055 [Phycisphaerales bacterium]|jgi:hypothetical protein
MFQFSLWDMLEPLKRAVMGQAKKPAGPARARPVVRARPVARRPAKARVEPDEAVLVRTRANLSTQPRSGVETQAKAAKVAKPKLTMQQRYDDTVAEMLAKYGVKVRKWRTTSSGVAWETTYRDGTKKRMLESPRPRGPMSIAIFLHEIGHHHIGLGAVSPRCLEEYHAWMFALREMRERGLPITERVEKRVHASLKYAVDKARRRGIREIPAELAAYSGPVRR